MNIRVLGQVACDDCDLLCEVWLVTERRTNERGDFIGTIEVREPVQAMLPPGWEIGPGTVRCAACVAKRAEQDAAIAALWDAVPAGDYVACRFEDHREGEDLFVVERRASEDDRWPWTGTITQQGTGLVRWKTAAVPAERSPEVARALLAVTRASLKKQGS